MKTIITENIDGYEVIKAFSVPVIEPIETEKKTRSAIVETQEYKDVERKKQELNNRLKMAHQVNDSMRAMYKKNPNCVKDEKYVLLLSEKTVHEGKAQELLKEIVALSKTAKDKYRELYIQSAEYFEPRGGETLVPAVKADALKKQADALGEWERLCVDGSVIIDKRGVKYWIKETGTWIKKDIFKINVDIEPGGKMYSDLSEIEKQEIGDQLETERINALSPAEKTAEKNNIIDGLAGQAAMMKSKLEIQGDAAALKKSQDWYNTEVAKVETKYA